MKKFFALILLFMTTFSFAKNGISDFTEDCVYEFLSKRIEFKSMEDNEAITKISGLRDEILSQIELHAVDLDQEKLILEAMYFMEIYQHSINQVEILAAKDKKASVVKRAALRDQMKSYMKRMEKCIEDRKNRPISEWLYMFTGDVTAFYMTRSVAATLLRGFSVRDYYKSAIKVNPEMTPAIVSLGNWCFYAPSVFGGGKKKASSYFDTAIKTANLPGEKYVAYLSYAQLAFENKKTEITDEYMQKIIDLNLGRKEIDVILRCNKKGYSYFQYMRNRVGIDEELSEEEKTEEDK